MTEATTFQVRAILGKYPVTRSRGKDGRDRLDDILSGYNGLDLTIDFSGVEAMNQSFVDEFLGRFLVSHDFGATDATVKVTGLDEDTRFSIVVCVERRDTQVAILDSGALTLVGDKFLAETFEKALTLGTFRATALAEELKLSAQNANNRLKRLTAAGALRKSQVTGSSRGGKEFEYTVVSSHVADGQPLTPA